jgi:nucleotide-binding universal stress UspA family protein
MMRVLIPIDGSVLSMRAVDHAARFIHEGEVVLLHVAGIPPQLLEHGGASRDEEERELECQVGEQCRRYRQEILPAIEREVFLPAKERLVRGARGANLVVVTILAIDASFEPALSILAEAKQHPYDAIIIGRHGRTGLLQFLLGGTAAKLVHHIQTTPIWLVP